MSITNRMAPDLIKGTLSPLILKLLSDRGRMYGYEITQQIKILSQDRILLKEGTLYPALYKLQAEGLVSAEEEIVGKRLRRYYTLTAAGKSCSTEQVNLVLDFAEMLQELFKPSPVLSNG